MPPPVGFTKKEDFELFVQPKLIHIFKKAVYLNFFKLKQPKNMYCAVHMMHKKGN